MAKVISNQEREMDQDRLAVVDTEAVAALKKTWWRVFIAWRRWTIHFVVLVIFFRILSEAPDTLAWLTSSVAWPDANYVYHPVWEPFKKWMLLAAIYVLVLTSEVIGAVRRS